MKAQKNSYFFSELQVITVFTFNLRFLYELKYKVSASKTVCGIFHSRFRFVFIKVNIFVQKMHGLFDFKGATKSYFTHYSFAVFILFNTSLCKSAFSTNSFRKLVFYRSALFVFSACYVSNLM